MTSYELNELEIEQLKEQYYYDNNEECQLYYDNWYDIEDDVIREWYSGINFVKEDFFCNINN